MKRSRLTIRGTVQGVGFRPFLHRLANECGVTGFVANDGRGVICEVQGPDLGVDEFIRRARSDAPPAAVVDHIGVQILGAIAGEVGFTIAASRRTERSRLAIGADITTCSACLAEMGDPGNRRFEYPFICCTDCGPRYTVVSSLPYDRERTSMAPFPLCTLCLAEYHDPADRRFHAQATCCADCGPRLEYRAVTADSTDPVLGAVALDAAVAALVDGRIVAIKGLGGFQLTCRADDEAAVARLRQRKARIDKPFALLAPTVEVAEEYIVLDHRGREALADPGAPIVLAPRRTTADVAVEVAPRHATLGVMLPSSPLHHLLVRRVFARTGSIIVCTSGNRSDEPMVIDDDLVGNELSEIADAVLGHNRPVERRADDSVGRVVAGRFRVLRRARGLAPQSIELAGDGPTILAVGAELKNTIGVAIGHEAVLSVHIGDLEHPGALHAFEVTVADLLDLVGGSIDLVVHDQHPEYLSTKFALAADLAPTLAVQHHHAHMASCLADNGHDGQAIGVTFDGLGWGTDGTLWGGEFLIGDAGGFERVAHLKSVPMPDGAAAIREPWRMAVHHLRAAGVEPPEVGWLADRPIDSVPAGPGGVTTTSMGRLFDAIGALCGVAGGDVARHEGQAAAQLEQLAETADIIDDADGYPVAERSTGGGPSVIEVDGLLTEVANDLVSGIDPAVVAHRFHQWVADVIVATCRGVRHHGGGSVALTGGVFQNRLLTETTRDGLQRSGFEVLLHRRVPANDGGIALGQLAIARAVAGMEPPSTMAP